MRTMGVALVAVLMVTAGAKAELHVTQQFGVGFDGAIQNASASLTASGSATLSGSGTYYSWVGWPVSSWASVTISFNDNTVGIGTNPDTISLNSDPDGNGLVTFETVTDTLSQGMLDDLNLDLKDGASWGLALEDIVLTGDYGVKLTLETTGTINSLGFDMTGASTGTYASGAFPSITYNVNPTGTVSGSYTANIGGTLELLGIPIGLGQLASFSDSVTMAASAPGTMTLTELVGSYDKDVAVELHANTTAVDIPLSTSGSDSVNTYAGSKNPYFKVSFNYDLGGNLNVGSASIDLYDTIIDAIPEPSTVAVLGLGGALFALSRRRRK